MAAASDPPETKTSGPHDDPLALFGAPVAEWFRSAFEAPTPADLAARVQAALDADAGIDAPSIARRPRLLLLEPTHRVRGWMHTVCSTVRCLGLFPS